MQFLTYHPLIVDYARIDLNLKNAFFHIKRNTIKILEKTFNYTKITEFKECSSLIVNTKTTQNN